MSGLMNAISRGLSQAGYAAGDMYARQSMADQAAAQQTERDKRLAEMQELAAIRAEDRKNAPMNRLGEKAKEFAAEEIQREDQPVTELSGRLSYDGVGPGREGFTGDLATVQKAIAAMPEGADKKAAMTRLQQQLSEDNATAGLINAGQTRKRTADEALSAAADDAKVNDPIAYAEYEAKIGKPQRDERRIETVEKKAENAAMAAGRESDRKATADANRFAMEMNRLDLQAGNLDAQNRKIDAWIHNEATKRENDLTGKGVKQDRLTSIINSMNQTISNLTNSSKGNTKESRDEWQMQYDNAVQVRSRASQLLNEAVGNRGDGPKPEPAATPPKPAASSNRASQFKVIR